MIRQNSHNKIGIHYSSPVGSSNKHIWQAYVHMCRLLVHFRVQCSASEIQCTWSQKILGSWMSFPLLPSDRHRRQSCSWSRRRCSTSSSGRWGTGATSQRWYPTWCPWQREWPALERTRQPRESWVLLDLDRSPATHTSTFSSWSHSQTVCHYYADYVLQLQISE